MILSVKGNLWSTKEYQLQEIVSFFPFLPQPGDGGFGIALLSYENQIACSLLTDKSLLPDGGKGIPKLFTSQVQKLLEL